MARACALQLNNQSRVPDLVCFHQNGANSISSYQHIIQDLKLQYQTEWIHTPSKLTQDQWYSKSLEVLVSQGCDVMFWCDDDDVYYHHHIESTLVHLTVTKSDLVISNTCDSIRQDDRGFNIWRNIPFTAHAFIGVSSSMAFNRAFAEELLKDFALNVGNRLDGKPYLEWADWVVHEMTAPKFKRAVISHDSVAYLVHRGAYTSNCWEQKPELRAFTPRGQIRHEPPLPRKVGRPFTREQK
jgi:hypothetical protein